MSLLGESWWATAIEEGLRAVGPHRLPTDRLDNRSGRPRGVSGSSAMGPGDPMSDECHGGGKTVTTGSSVDRERPDVSPKPPEVSCGLHLHHTIVKLMTKAAGLPTSSVSRSASGGLVTIKFTQAPTCATTACQHDQTQGAISAVTTATAPSIAAVDVGPTGAPDHSALGTCADCHRIYFSPTRRRPMTEIVVYTEDGGSCCLDAHRRRPHRQPTPVDLSAGPREHRRPRGLWSGAI